MTTYRIPPCMGGWCAQREGCARYHERSAQPPAERLCGKHGRNVFLPIVSKPVKEAA